MKEDAAFAEVQKQWADKGYRVTGVLDPPDMTWVEEWVKWNQSVMAGVKLIFGDKDTWGYFGALIIYSVGEGNLTKDQEAEIDAIRVILAKTDMSMADIGQMQGRLIHLINPELRALLQGRAPGLLTILDVLARIGGVA